MSIARRAGAILLLNMLIAGCGRQEPAPAGVPGEGTPATGAAAEAPVRPEVYAEFELVSDLSGFSDKQRQMISVLIDASEIMDDLFWKQAFGDEHKDWLASIEDDRTRAFARMNYGPWDRLDDENSFIAGAGKKPLGAGFYPADMTREEFDAANLEGKVGL